MCSKAKSKYEEIGEAPRENEEEIIKKRAKFRREEEEDEEDEDKFSDR